MAIAAKVKIFTTPWCPYCIRAKKLLKQKGVAFEDVNVAFNGEMRQKLQAMTGSHTVPQIFINDVSVGGCDEIHALDAVGELDRLLSQAP